MRIEGPPPVTAADRSGFPLIVEATAREASQLERDGADAPARAVVKCRSVRLQITAPFAEKIRKSTKAAERCLRGLSLARSPDPVVPRLSLWESPMGKENA